MNAIDLHVHSNCSDGSLSPAALVSHAIEKGLVLMALTDHDTVAGMEEALAESERLSTNASPFTLIPGVELSTEYESKDIHILGLDIDYQDASFLQHLKTFQESRTRRNQKMCDLLCSHGVPVTYENLLAEYPYPVLTRSHYAEYMLKHGLIKARKEAFERYIGDYSPCFIPREKVTPEQAISLIVRAGGIPVLAHPVLYGFSKDRLTKLVSHLKDVGLVALEAVYSTYALSDEREMKALAKSFQLKITGGSDFHGDIKPGLSLGTGYGKLFVPEEIWFNLKENI